MVGVVEVRKVHLATETRQAADQHGVPCFLKHETVDAQSVAWPCRCPPPPYVSWYLFNLPQNTMNE